MVSRARRLVLATLVSLLLAGCSQAGVVTGGKVGPPPAGIAASVLVGLPVKGRAPGTGYRRDQFGERWHDIDRNGCDQRNDVLARDLTEPVFRPGTRSCVVVSGMLRDPYTGREHRFVRGPSTSDDIQIDHVVALFNAWQTGAQQLDPETRQRLANDPLNLQATEGAVNQAKGHSDAASWLPPARGFRCAYVARQVAVKAKYSLWVTAAERDAIERVLTGCPEQRIPAE